MRRVVLGTALVCLFAGARAQPTGAARPADTEMLWQVLGSVSALELDLAGTDVRTAHLVVMYDDGVLLQDHVDVDPKENTIVTVNAGALNPGLVSWCDRAYVVLWARHEHAGGVGVTASETCDGGEDVQRVVDFPSDPFDIPNRVPGQELDLSMGRWLLLGLTFLDDDDEGFSEVDLSETSRDRRSGQPVRRLVASEESIVLVWVASRLRSL